METLYTRDINTNPRKFALPLLAAALLLLPACLRTPPTEIPIPGIPVVDADPANKSLLIMLPGRGDRAEIFEASGFLDGAEHWNFDVLTVDAHFGYYRERSLIRRLHEDIIAPARAHGYDNIWLLGVSMGGFGSLLYANRHSDNIGGVILLAPFLGDPELPRRIDAAGGLHAWSGADAPGFSDPEIGIWSWLKHASNGANGSRVILGYGRSDRLAEAYGPLIEALDPSQIYRIDGGHSWTTWRPLWSRIVADLEL